MTPFWEHLPKCLARKAMIVYWYETLESELGYTPDRNQGVRCRTRLAPASLHPPNSPLKAVHDPHFPVGEFIVLGSSSCENQRQEGLLQANAFPRPEILKMNAHAIRADRSDHSRTRTHGRPAGLKFQTDRDKGT